MPFVQLAEGELHYQLDGPVDAPVLVLSNSLGTDLHMWDIQIPAFTEHFRVLRFDTRGHGKSLVTEGPYSIEQLGRDVMALLDALDIQRAHFCGLSMGGLIGQWLGIHAGERLQRLVVCNTAAKIGTPEIWNPRIEMVLRDGAAAMVALRDASIARWFTADFAAANPHQAQQITDMLAATSPQGYAANCAAVRDADFREQLALDQSADPGDCRHRRCGHTAGGQPLYPEPCAGRRVRRVLCGAPVQRAGRRCVQRPCD